MTSPSPATIEREKDKLFITDAELIRMLGIDPKVVRPVIKALDADPASGFPKKGDLFANRRYRPAVEHWLLKHDGVMAPPAKVIPIEPLQEGNVYRIYFLASPTHVKIGITAGHVKKRMRAIRQNHYEKLEVLAVIPDVPRTLEKELHRKFSTFKVKGEWFTRSQEIEDFIQLVREGLGHWKKALES